MGMWLTEGRAGAKPMRGAGSRILRLLPRLGLVQHIVTGAAAARKTGARIMIQSERTREGLFIAVEGRLDGFHGPGIRESRAGRDQRR